MAWSNCRPALEAGRIGWRAGAASSIFVVGSPAGAVTTRFMRAGGRRAWLNEGSMSGVLRPEWEDGRDCPRPAFAVATLLERWGREGPEGSTDGTSTEACCTGLIFRAGAAFNAGLEVALMFRYRFKVGERGARKLERH